MPQRARNNQRSRKTRRPQKNARRGGRKSQRVSGRVVPGTQTVSRRVPAPGMGGLQLSHPSRGLTRATCSFANPFCPEAFGARWPDGQSQGTIPYTYHYTIPTKTGSAPNCTGIWVYPDWSFGYSSTGAVGGTYTLPNLTAHVAPATNFAATNVGFNARVVSMGAIARVTSNAANSSGRITVRPIGRYTATDTPPSGVLPPAGDGAMVIASPGAEISFISKPNGPSAREFKVANSNTGAESCDWTIAMFELSDDMPSSTNVVIEVFVHIEIMVQPNSNGFSAFARKSEDIPIVANTVKHVAGTTPSSMSNVLGNVATVVDDVITKSATAIARTAMSDPVATLSGAAALLAL